MKKIELIKSTDITGIIEYYTIVDNKRVTDSTVSAGMFNTTEEDYIKALALYDLTKKNLYLQKTKIVMLSEIV